ncbi:MAG: hypothetical protein Q9170_001088 [Blastenia crenularia]
MLSIKASLLLLYLRISPCVIFRRCVKVLLVLFAADAIIFSVLALFQCSPVDRAWIWSKPGHCMNRELGYRCQALLSLAENLIVIALPIPTIVKLHMPRRRRGLLLVVFAAGLDNPLHIALFPPHLSAQGAYLEFSFLLNASLDIFERRTRDPNRVDQDLGMLQAIDERLSIWGWETGTGTKFAAVVDMWGKEGRPISRLGVKGEDVKPAFKALQTAYIRLLQNPFYTPDDHTPAAVQSGRGRGGEITSQRFIDEVKRIGDMWRPGLEKV